MLHSKAGIRDIRQCSFAKRSALTCTFNTPNSAGSADAVQLPTKICTDADLRKQGHSAVRALFFQVIQEEEKERVLCTSMSDSGRRNSASLHSTPPDSCTNCTVCTAIDRDGPIRAAMTPAISTPEETDMPTPEQRAEQAAYLQAAGWTQYRKTGSHQWQDPDDTNHWTLYTAVRHQRELDRLKAKETS